MTVAGGVIGAWAVIVVIALGVSYRKYSHLIDARLADGPFRDSVNVYMRAADSSPWWAIRHRPTL